MTSEILLGVLEGFRQSRSMQPGAGVAGHRGIALATSSHPEQPSRKNGTAQFNFPE
jgi:hypothetical protein